MKEKVVKRKKRRWMCIIPDILTISRPFFGLAIGFMGLLGAKALPIVTLLVMAGWTTDIIDGRVARWAAEEWGRFESRIGKYEIHFDDFLVVGILAYLGEVHLIPTWLAIGYGMLLFLFGLIWSVPYKVNFAFEALAVIATFLIVVIAAGRPTLGYVVIWGFLLLVYDWDRAMELGGSLKKVLSSIWQGYLSFPPAYLLASSLVLGSSLGFLLFVGLIFGFRTIQAEVLGGVSFGLLVLLIYRSWLLRP